MAYDSIHILIVDDEETNREIAARHFKKLGFTNLGLVNDGKEAFEYLERTPETDVIFLDRMMPVMDGLTLCRELQRVNFGQFPVVIFQTGKVALDDLNAILDVGVMHILKKPYGRKEVAEFAFPAFMEAIRKRQFFEVLKDKPKLALDGAIEFSIITLNDAKEAAIKLAQYYDEGLLMANAVYELLVNAVEHAHLKVTHAEKLEWMQQGVYEEKIDEAATAKGEKVEVQLKNQNGALLLTIKDCGAGFDISKFEVPTTATILSPFFTGIPKAKLAFSQLEYDMDTHSIIAVK